VDGTLVTQVLQVLALMDFTELFASGASLDGTHCRCTG